MDEIPDCLKWTVQHTRHDLELLHDCLLDFWAKRLENIKEVEHLYRTSYKGDQYLHMDEDLYLRMERAWSCFYKQHQYLHHEILRDLDHGKEEDLNERVHSYYQEVARLLVWESDLRSLIDRGFNMHLPDQAEPFVDRFDRVHAQE
jgi:hypothetical protein